MQAMQAAAKSFRPSAGLDTPYRQAQQEWDRRMGTARVQAHGWKMAFFASVGVMALMVFGLVYVGTRPKLMPHIIVVDQLGQSAYRGPIDPGAEWNPGEPAIRFDLRRFLAATREISSDAAVLKRNWLDAYALVTRNGSTMLSAYVQEHDPFKRAKEERVTIEVTSMVRVTAKTWQVDWRETTFDKNGNQLGPAVPWRAMFQTFLKRPTTEEELQKNPTGLFIEEFSWDRIRT